MRRGLVRILRLGYIDLYLSLAVSSSNPRRVTRYQTARTHQATTTMDNLKHIPNKRKTKEIKRGIIPTHVFPVLTRHIFVVGSHTFSGHPRHSRSTKHPPPNGTIRNVQMVAVQFCVAQSSRDKQFPPRGEIPHLCVEEQLFDRHWKLYYY